ncbi:MAG: hypothetical protein A2498_02880 [Lentisphaerae bacterium RIFOXYC12_FULL_60_16]|nr:MAG: hypothetical protein A2498_02880 [Lentisphaerae bacterium RIFOXYC12_FULL_60_16]OGV76076.1 MAG: hypothetical protein A2340_10810 [Lentisphaerae bacterium RIFOXYB12_FULL_60_10]
MIIDTLGRLPGYQKLNSHFKKAIAFLGRKDLATLADGRHEIDGDRVYAMVMHPAARPKEGAKLEAHRRYIDIQVVLAGTDNMGWRAVEECRDVEQAYAADKDCMLFRDPVTMWVPISSGMMAIFLPEDAHAPSVGAGILHKVVVKVLVA